MKLQNYVQDILGIKDQAKNVTNDKCWNCEGRERKSLLLHGTLSKQYTGKKVSNKSQEKNIIRNPDLSDF